MKDEIRKKVGMGLGMTESLLAQRDLFGQEIEYFEGEKHIRSYMPSYFIICPLPTRSTKKDVKEYKREYNNFELRLVGSNGIPGGKIARDMLMLFATEAVYQKGYNESKEVNLHFDSISKFEKSIGTDRRNYNKRIIELLEQFSTCSMSFRIERREIFSREQLGKYADRVEKGTKDVMLGLKSVTNIPFMTSVRQIDRLREEDGRGEPIAIDIQLSRQFVDMVSSNAVPVDFTIYKEIGSTLEKDLYAWFLYRNNGNIGKDGIFVSRKNLIDQFGEDGLVNDRMKYSRILDGVKNIKLHYYEGLKFEIIDSGSANNKGIVLYKSPAVMKEKDVRFVPLVGVVRDR